MADLLTAVEVFHLRLVAEGPRSLGERLLYALLIPLSLLFGCVAWVRGKCYDLQLLPIYSANVPVISVGNIVAGGTGKTPVVDLLLKRCLDLGKRPAVVSRGYGGSFAGEVGIVCRGDGTVLRVEEAGDESFLLARRNPSAVVVIAKKRARGVQLAVEQLGADLIILDDGFQHRAVARDVDLLLFDAARPFSNGLPMPAGLLREFPWALKRADLLLATRADGGGQKEVLGRPCSKSRHQLADEVISLDGERVALGDLYGKEVLAFAGIAHPDKFFAALTAKGLTLGNRLPKSDHTGYDQVSIDLINDMSAGMDALVTTEKDGVKLAAEMFNLPCYQIPLELEIENEATFMQELQTYLWSV